MQEWQLALEESEERYTELQSKHQAELEDVRKAGHDTLAIIVEEYKVQSLVATACDITHRSHGPLG